MTATVHLVDGSLYVCRAWFAQVPDVNDAEGQPVHAVHGFARFLLDLKNDPRETHNLALNPEKNQDLILRMNTLLNQLMANLPSASKLRLRMYVERGREIEVSFDVAGAQEAIDRVYTSCQDDKPAS